MFGAAPLPDPAEVDRRVAAATAALAALPPGTPEHRAARVELATYLFARYTAAGDEADRAAIAATCRDVLADPGATARERQAVGLIQPVLTMLALFRPGAAQLPGADDLAGRMREVAAQADAVSGATELPSEVRGVMRAVGGFAGLMEDAQRDDWDGRIAPEDAARFADLPADLPGREAVTGLLAWLGGPADAGERAGELRSALAGLPGDHLLAPVLRLDLARAVAGDPATAGRDALDEAAALLERARDGLEPGGAFHDETVRSLAGVLLATAAHTPTRAAVERVERAVADVLGRPRDGSPADRGAAALLQALVDQLRAVVDGDRTAEAVTRGLTEAIGLLPTDHPLRPVAVGQAAALLADRFLLEGRIANADAALLVADELIRAAATQDDGSAPFLRCVAGLCRVTRAGRVGDGEALGDATATLRAGLAGLPGHDLMRPTFALVAAVADLQLAAASGDRARLWTAAQAARQVLDTGPPAGVAQAAAATLAGMLDTVQGALAGDPAVVTAAIARMEADLDDEGDAAVAVADQRVARRALLGQAYLAAHELGVDGAADRAVAHLTAALDLLGERRPGVQRQQVLHNLALAHRARGDRSAALEAGFAALESLAGVVLLQSGAGDAVRTARGASADAAMLARWCLDDGEPARAAQAVELGRGLALHTAVSTARVPDLLRAAGDTELAREWDGAGAATGPVGWAEALSTGLGPSGDLRERVLDVLRATRGGAALFTAPPLGAVAEALGAVGADVLVYLVPGAVDGDLVLVDRKGGARAVAAPGLRVEPTGPPARFVPLCNITADPVRRRRVLREVLDWAGATVVGPLRAALPGDGAPRVVLVPADVLGAVPWAAARLPGPGPARHACQDMVISTAASARQLLDVVARVPAATGPAVLVGDPTGSLPRATEEVTALREGPYPAAVVLDGSAATPDAVLDRLPDAGLVHLACHAVSAESVDESRLELTAPLPVRRVLDRATRRTGTAGPRVVLSSCSSDLTGRDHDEALTLATAFLAAGAVTAVATRWPILDRSAGVVAFALHHFLATGLPAAEALRRTQLWLLDPARAPLPGMPEPLRRRCRRAVLADPTVWAAFGHQGR